MTLEATPTFELWLEFEHWKPRPDEDPEADFFNMSVTLSDGRRYAANVWTYGFLAIARAEASASGESLGGRYLLAPDLFVERLDRGLLEEVIVNLLRGPGLPSTWLTRAPPP